MVFSAVRFYAAPFWAAQVFDAPAVPAEAVFVHKDVYKRQFQTFKTAFAFFDGQ